MPQYVSPLSRRLQSNAVLYGAAIALRIVISSFPAVADYLAHRVELVTPLTSFKRLTEGVYLYNSSVPPYDGGVFHQAPLLLCIFSFLESIPFRFTIPLFYSLMDVAVAHGLQKITRAKQAQDATRPKLAVENAMHPIQPWVVAAFYLFNPFTILSCVSRSTILFTNLSVVAALVCVLHNRTSMAMFWAALAAYLSFYPVMLVPPLIMLTCRGETRKTISAASLFLGYIAVFLGLSRLLVGSWDFVGATYGVILFLSDLTPNIGMFWYFFIEIFDQFRSFFMVVFQLHAFIFTAPLCLKFRHRPLFVSTILTGIMATFKSYPSAGDTALFLGLVPMHDELFKYCRYGFLICNIFCYSSVLAPIFWHLWLYAGSGNANFFYAITLVYNLGQVLLIVDLVYAALRRDFDIEKPEAIGKHVVQK